MKKTLLVGLCALLVGSALTFAGFTSAKEGSDDKIETNRKEAEINVSQKLSGTSDTRFSFSVNQNGMVKIQGKVVASPTAGASANRISVQSWLGTYTVDTTNAKVIYRYGGNGSLGDIHVGDMIIFDGVLANQSDTVIVAKLIRNLSMWSKNVEKGGVISNIDTGARTFLLTLPNSSDIDQLPTVVKVTVPTDARIRVKNTEVSFSALVNGSRVKVSGVYNANIQTITARKIELVNTPKPIRILTTTSSATSTAQ